MQWLLQNIKTKFSVEIFSCPSDSTTVKFVTKFYKKNHVMPVFVRKSWKPVLKIMGKN